MAFSSWRTWLTGEVVTAAHMNQEVRDNGLALFPDGAAGNVWSPVLQAVTTNPSTLAVAGVEYTIGPIQFCWVRFVLSTPGSGTYFVDLPSPAAGVTDSLTDGAGQTVGTFLIRDDSPGWVRGGAVYLHTTSQVYFVFYDTLTENGLLTHNNIRAWASGDVLSLHAQYPIA
jgi:hypothetical protein